MVASFESGGSVAIELSRSNWNVVEAPIAIDDKAFVSQLT